MDLLTACHLIFSLLQDPKIQIKDHVRIMQAFQTIAPQCGVAFKEEHGVKK